VLDIRGLKTSKKLLPSEFSSHEATIVMLPYRKDIWRDDAKHAQEVIFSIVQIISKHERVYFCVDRKQTQVSLPSLNSNVVLCDVAYDDIWARDISPLFLFVDDSLVGARFGFNAWGGKDEGSYWPWDNDAVFPTKFCDILGINSFEVDLILEGGALAYNGANLIVTTESVLLNRNRNPNATKAQIEQLFFECFGIEKIIWIKRGFDFDETNGHIDVFLNFVDEYNIMLAWTEDSSNPQYPILHEVEEQLKTATAVDGKPFEIHKTLMPMPMRITAEEAAGIIQHDSALTRAADLRLYPTYNNAYIFNGGVLVPTFNCPEDEIAVKQFQNLFPDRIVYPLYSKEILIGGGNFHCILHEIPRRHQT